MQEKTLIKISLVTTIIGLLFLFFYVDNLEIKISDLSSAKPEEEIKISGVVERLSTEDKVIFLTINGYKEEINEVVVFNDEEIFLEEGDYIEVTGLVENYQGKKEIIANKIRK